MSASVAKNMSQNNIKGIILYNWNVKGMISDHIRALSIPQEVSSFNTTQINIKANPSLNGTSNKFALGKKNSFDGKSKFRIYYGPNLRTWK